MLLIGNSNSEWTEHLEELRRRIIAVLVIFAISAGVSFWLSETIISFLLAPVSRFGIKLYTFSPPEKFMAYVEISFLTGAVFTLPFALLQTALFIWPGLKDRERLFSAAAMTFIPFLFVSGSAFAYLYLSPIVMKFFLSFGGTDSVAPLWGLREYLKMLFGIMIASGMVFQTPLAMLLMFGLGLTTPQQVARLRPYIVLLIFFLAGVLTPPDVISQLALGIPLYLLFELSLFLGRFIRK